MTETPERFASPLRDVATVARRLGISIKTVRRMIDRGELPVHRVGRLLRLSDADVDAYVQSRRSLP